jgi:hypothetical protein
LADVAISLDVRFAKMFLDPALGTLPREPRLLDEGFFASGPENERNPSVGQRDAGDCVCRRDVGGRTIIYRISRQQIPVGADGTNRFHTALKHSEYPFKKVP